MKTDNAVLLSVLLMVALITSACFSDFGTQTRNKNGTSAGKGAVYLTIAGSDSRTIFPNGWENLDYTATFTSGEKNVTETLSGGSGTVTLDAGIWNIGISAKFGNVVVGTASVSNVVVTEGGITDIIAVKIVPVTDGANGTVQWSVKFPTVVSNAQLYYHDANSANSGGINLIDVSNGSLSLAPGSWLFRAELSDDSGKSAGDTEAVHVYSGMNSILSWVFNESSFDIWADILLSADVSKAGDTYAYIKEQKATNKETIFGIESPDENAAGGHTGVQHIRMISDATYPDGAKDVFAFDLHWNDSVKDGNATGDQTRQRIELKIDSDEYRGFDGLSFAYRWKFKLPADFAPSTEFTHIHQIKNEQGDASAAIITLTPRVLSNGNRVIQLIYRAPTQGYGNTGSTNSTNTNLVQISLNDFLGEWLQAEETVTYSSNPDNAAYSISITRIKDSKVLLAYTHSTDAYNAVVRAKTNEAHNDPAQWPFVTWRSGNQYGRPKYGLYRLVYSDSALTQPVSGLKDETILYADFELKKL